MIARDLSFFSFILLSPILVLIPLNLYCHYYLVTHVPPGYPSPRAVALNPRGSVSTDSETKWYNLDQRSIWTPERWGFHRKTGKTRSLTGDDGVSYSNAGGAQGRRVRRCRKCDGPKPEVSNRAVYSRHVPADGRWAAYASLLSVQAVRSDDGPPLSL